MLRPLPFLFILVGLINQATTLLSVGEADDISYNPTLWCWSVMAPSERPLGKAALEEGPPGTGIRACDEYTLFQIGSGGLGDLSAHARTRVIEFPIESQNRTHHCGTCLDCCPADEGVSVVQNTPLFMAVWRQVLQMPEVKIFDFVVKVDLDTVFFPSRLRRLVSRREGSLLLLNFMGPPPGIDRPIITGLHGPIEVVSRDAMGKLTDGLSQCMAEIDQHYLAEDWFLEQCFISLNIPRAFERSLLYETYGHTPTCGCKHVAYHPLKTKRGSSQCLLEGASCNGEPLRRDVKVAQHISGEVQRLDSKKSLDTFVYVPPQTCPEPPAEAPIPETAQVGNPKWWWCAQRSFMASVIKMVEQIPDADWYFFAMNTTVVFEHNLRTMAYRLQHELPEGDTYMGHINVWETSIPPFAQLLGGAIVRGSTIRRLVTRNARNCADKQLGLWAWHHMDWVLGECLGEMGVKASGSAAMQANALKFGSCRLDSVSCSIIENVTARQSMLAQSYDYMVHDPSGWSRMLSSAWSRPCPAYTRSWEVSACGEGRGFQAAKNSVDDLFDGSELGRPATLGRRLLRIPLASWTD